MYKKNKNKKIKKIKSKRKVKMEGEKAIRGRIKRQRGVSEKESEKENRGVEREKLISKIYGNQTVGFRRSKR